MSRHPLLLVGCLLLVTGCGTSTSVPQPPGTGGGVPVSGSGDTATPRPASPLCGDEAALTVRYADATVRTERDDLDTDTASTLLVVLDSDIAVRLRAGGSTLDTVELPAGVSAVCLSYPSVGRYPVVVGDTVAFHVEVRAVAAS